MSLNTILLICAALFPAIALCVYVFKKDRVEKEPIGLLMKLFVLGAIVCTLGAVIFGNILEPIAIEITAPFAEQSFYESIYLVLYAFVVVALVEEGLKFIVMYFVTRNNKNFNSLFDGIVYAVFVSLGFAALENVLYVLQNGFGTAIARAIMSVPCHMFFAVIMGYYYSFWHMYDVARKQEISLKDSGFIDKNAPEFSGKRHLIMSIVMPTLAHGLYDYGLFRENVVWTLIALAFTVFLYIYCFKRIKNMSKKDVNDITYSAVMLYEKYPYLKALSTENTGETKNEEVNL